MPENRDKSFGYIADSRSQILILGSFPGRESLRRKQYYANSNNTFWKIMADISGCVLPASYAARTGMLLENRIALWDVVLSCSRLNSSDSNIRSAMPNDIPKMLKKHHCIKAIFFNGKASERIFGKYFNCVTDIPAFCLPSTSPAYASLTYKAKLAAWKKIVKYLRPRRGKLFLSGGGICTE